MTLSPAFLTTPIAHRALHGAAGPENSGPAIQAAIDAGYGIEIDIQPAKCGTPMVFHDYQLQRLTGAAGMINQTTLKDLHRLTLMNSAAQIPTLAQVLDMVQGRVPLLIEIKDQDGALGPALGSLEEAVSQALQGYDGPVAMMSFNPHSVAHFASLSPMVPRGCVTCLFEENRWPHVPVARRTELATLRHARAPHVDFISHRHTDLRNPHVAQIKAAGKPVLCWTTRTQSEDTTARQIADNVTFESYHPA